MHLPPILGQERGIGEAILEGRGILQHRRHRQQAVEPVAELAREGLADPISGVPLPPVVLVRAVLESAETDYPCVQPGVAHIEDARDRRATLGTGDFDRIHVGPVRGVPLEFLPACHRSLLEFVLIADDLKVAARLALPDRQRQPPVALLTDHPVMHVAQPVQLAVQAERGDPANLPGHLHHIVAQFVH